MFYIILILLFFAASVMMHMVYCRKTDRPGLHAKMFIVIAIFFLCMGLIAALAVRHTGLIDPNSLWGCPFMISAALIFILLIPIYLCFYVLTQLTSPSKKILSVVALHAGMDYAHILSAVEKENFIGTRLDDLLSSGCVIFTEGRYALTPEGQKVAAILDVMQVILGRKAGG